MQNQRFLRSFASLAIAAALALPGLSEARPFSRFVEFSGALSDTGNFASVNGESPAPFYQNRTTNGLVAGELLGARLGFKVVSSNHLVGPPQGDNYAVRDALAGGNGKNDLPQQLKAYFEANGGKADPDALYFLFNGGNDVILAVLEPDDKKSDQLLTNAVHGLENAIRTLAKHGAKTVMAPNFIDLSVVPIVRNAKITERAKRISDRYNRQFEAMLDRVEPQLKIKLIRWDFDGFLKDLIKHGDEFGFTNTADACTALQAEGKCDFDRFVFLNDTFPTAKVHELMAQAMALAILERDRSPGHSGGAGHVDRRKTRN